MKFIAKVISDNGYKIELIRPLRDMAFQLGATVEISLTPKQVDLINTFNNLLDDETRNMILDKFNEARTPAVRVSVGAPVTSANEKQTVRSSSKKK